MGTLLFVLAVVVVIAWYLSWTATRLDRLHGRIETARATLDAQLLRRALAALDLATSACWTRPAASCSWTRRRRPGPPTSSPASSPRAT